MSDLSRYRGKRNPATTTEPFSAEHSGRATGQQMGTSGGRFVIHQHAARRMHYDLRLPVAGALSSFAIPEGLSLDPAVKRLAVHTENHPQEYLEFEDTISEGNYGAGAMIVWDTGGVIYHETTIEEGIERGKIDFTLSGFKVSGRFALIATGRRRAQSGLAGTSKAENQWLLVKKPDASADKTLDLGKARPRSVLSGLTVAELPRKAELSVALLRVAQRLGAKAIAPSSATFRPPMLCQAADGPLEGADWLYELKLDGVRILAEKTGDDVKLHYRSGRPTTRSYPDVARALRALPIDHAVLDGEIVAFDERGRPRFSRLGARIRASRPGDIQQAMQETPVAFLVFDLLQLGQEGQRVDLRPLAQEARNEVRAQLLRGSGIVRNLDHIEAQGKALWQLVTSEELEGMVAKRRNAPYEHGPSRPGTWRKIKRAQEEEFVVVGWTAGASNSEDIGALLVGAYRAGTLCYRGRVGSGFDRQARALLAQELGRRALSGTSPPGIELPTDVNEATLCRPELVARVRHQGYSDGGHLRAAVYLGLRDDVRPQECTAGPTDAADDGTPSYEGEQEVEPGEQVSLAPSGLPSLAPELSLTNLQKPYFPDEGITKGDLLRYYLEISGVMLPHLRGRPVVLVRYPDGITGKNFYQWRLPEGAPSFMRSRELWDDQKKQTRGGGKAAFLIDSAEALLYVINLGCIPLHVLASREEHAENCDFLTIDFDLGPRPLSLAVQLALYLREVLSDLGLPGYPKTSGQRGLHVLVALGPGVSFPSAQLLGELLGRILVAKFPSDCTMERRKDKRQLKLYIDTGQVGRSRTIVAPYSVRAVAGATVSTPLRWEELHLALDPRLFDLQTVPARVAQLGDPMADLLTQKPNLSSTLDQLARWTGAGRGAP